MTRFVAHEIYRDQLSKLGHGVPLWIPEPEARRPQSGGEVRIGDVGYFEDGQFVRLFNVLPLENRPGDHLEGPPYSIDPLIYNDRLLRNQPKYLQEGLYGNGISHHAQVGVNAAANAVVVPAGAGVAYQFTTTKAQGAMLLLPEPADLEQITTNTKFPKYMEQHHTSWVQYARKIGFGCKPEDIVLVRGTMKTSNWTVAAFQQDSRSGRASLNGSFTPVGLPVASAGFNLALGQQTACHRDSRSRPLLAGTILSGEPLSKDQCIFLRIYKAKSRFLRVWKPPKVMEAGAGPHQLPRHDGDDDNGPAGADAQIISDPDSDFQYIPVDIVLDYILDSNPEAEVAIACEDDITEMLGGASWPDDLRQYLQEYRPEVYVDPDTKLGTLSLVAPIARARVEEIRRNEQHNQPMDVDAGGNAGGGGGDDGGDDAPRGVDPLGEGRLILPHRFPHAPPFRWPHVALIDSSSDGSSVSCMALAPNGEHVATGMDDSVIRIWNYRTGSLTKKLGGHDDTPWSLSYSPDGTRLVSGSADNLAIIWDLTGAPEQSQLHRLEGHTSDVWSVAYSPDGRYIATASTDSSVRVWDPENGTQLRNFPAAEATVIQVLWTPDSTHLVSCGESGGQCWNISLADNQTPVRFNGHEAAIWCMNISKQGDRLITGSEDHTARIWSIETGDELVTLAGHDGAIWAVAFSDDGSQAVYGGYDSRVIVADSFTGEAKYVWGGENNSDEEIIVDTVSFSRAGDLVAAGAADGSVNLYNNRTGDFIAQYKAHVDKVKNIQFGRDDLDLISSSDDGSVRVFNLADTLRVGL
ncbi:hypothetical protein NM688_g4134 [Phlebia brevispora]|uniref:Uncharacterized protein n=1 Tax=Phlebia brevispora TaxID=194682 RepID=A0ACC1T3Q7_9APHY|nr:hypothetical protein NM688_g4134 [Phlebia brevispora]